MGFFSYVLCTTSRFLKTFASVFEVIILISKFHSAEIKILGSPLSEQYMIFLLCVFLPWFFLFSYFHSVLHSFCAALLVEKYLSERIDQFPTPPLLLNRSVYAFNRVISLRIHLHYLSLWSSESGQRPTKSVRPWFVKK